MDKEYYKICKQIRGLDIYILDKVFKDISIPAFNPIVTITYDNYSLDDNFNLVKETKTMEVSQHEYYE